MSPLKSIRKKCLECRENSYKAVEGCVTDTCVLHIYRMGKNPNAKPRVRGPMTDEHKAKLQAALAKAREAKKKSKE